MDDGNSAVNELHIRAAYAVTECPASNLVTHHVPVRQHMNCVRD